MMKLLQIHIKPSSRAKLTDAGICLRALTFSTMFILATLAQYAHADSSILKWKDEKGVTHYGDKLPAQEAGRGNSVLSKQGTVIKTNASYNAKTDTKEIEKTSAEQVRQDTALLASYSSVEEIDLAQSRNLKSDQLSLDTLRQHLSNLQTNLKNLNANYAGKKMPPDIVDDANTYRSQITKTKTEITGVERSIAETMTRFGKYRARYLELRQASNP
jgi:hypothetical protein